MKFKAGERVKVIRELMGITREDFAQVVNIEFIRLRNIEQGKVRMAEDEFAKVCSVFPEMMAWLTIEGEISLDSLKNSQQTLCKLMAAKIEAGQIPKGYDLETKIK